jgi:peptidoglycan/LPS O-acetylase OafA/YrhL
MARRIPSLDGLRAISIALVLLGHLGGTRNFPAALGFLRPYAYLGVRVFFVISGYLITGLKADL